MRKVHHIVTVNRREHVGLRHVSCTDKEKPQATTNYDSYD